MALNVRPIIRRSKNIDLKIIVLFITNNDNNLDKNK